MRIDREAKWGRHEVPALAYGGVASVPHARTLLDSRSSNDMWAAASLPRSSSATFGAPLTVSSSTRMRHLRRRASTPSLLSRNGTTTTATEATATSSGTTESKEEKQTDDSKRVPASSSSSSQKGSSHKGSGGKRVYRESGPRELAMGADLNAQLMALMAANVSDMSRPVPKPAAGRTPRTERGIARANNAGDTTTTTTAGTTGETKTNNNGATSSPSRLSQSLHGPLSASHRRSHATSMALSRPRQRPASAKTSSHKSGNKDHPALQGKPYGHYDRHCTTRDSRTYMSQTSTMFTPSSSAAATK